MLCLIFAVLMVMIALGVGALRRDSGPRHPGENPFSMLAAWGAGGAPVLFFVPVAVVLGALLGSPEHNRDLVRASLRGLLVPHAARRATLGGDAERDTIVNPQLPPGALELLLDEDDPGRLSLRVTDPRLGFRLTRREKEDVPTQKLTNQRQLFDGAVLLFLLESESAASTGEAPANASPLMPALNLEPPDPAGCDGRAIALRLGVNGVSVFRDLTIDPGPLASPPRIPRLGDSPENPGWGVPRYGSHSGLRVADLARWLQKAALPTGCRLPRIDAGRFVGLIYKKTDRNPNRNNRFFLHHVDRDLELCGDADGTRCPLTTGEVVELATIAATDRHRARSTWREVRLPEGNVIDLSLFPMRSSWEVEEEEEHRLAGRQRLYFPDSLARSYELRLVPTAAALSRLAPGGGRRTFPALRIDLERRRQPHVAARLHCPASGDERRFPHCIFPARAGTEASDASSPPKGLRFVLTSGGSLPHGLLQAPAPVVELPMEVLGGRKPWAYVDLLPDTSEQLFVLSQNDLAQRAVAFGELFTVGYGVRPLLTLQRLRSPFFLLAATLIPCLVLTLVLPPVFRRSLPAVLLLVFPLCLLTLRLLLAYRLFALAPFDPLTLPRAAFTLLVLPAATILTLAAGMIGRGWHHFPDPETIATVTRAAVAAALLTSAAWVLLPLDLPIDVRDPRVAGWTKTAAIGCWTLAAAGLGYLLLGRWIRRLSRRLGALGSAITFSRNLTERVLTRVRSLAHPSTTQQVAALLLPAVVLALSLPWLLGPRNALLVPTAVVLSLYGLVLPILALLSRHLRRLRDHDRDHFASRALWFCGAIGLVVVSRVGLASALGHREALYLGAERFGLSVVFTPLCVLLGAWLLWLTTERLRQASKDDLTRAHFQTLALWVVFIGALAIAAVQVRDYGIILVNLTALLLIAAPAYQVSAFYPFSGPRRLILRALMLSLMLPAVVLVALPVPWTGGILSGTMRLAGQLEPRETSLIRPALQRAMPPREWRTVPEQAIADLPAGGLRQFCPCDRETGGRSPSLPALFQPAPDISVYWGLKDLVFRLLRASRPDELDSIGAQSADREASAYLKARAYALGADGNSAGSGYLGSDIIDPPGGLLDALLNDDVVSMLLLPEIGWPGLWLLAAALLSLIAMTFRSPASAATRDRRWPHRGPRLVWALALGLLGWQGLYMVGVAMNRVPFTGKNVPLLNARSLSDFLEGSALVLLAAFALALSCDFSKRASGASSSPRTGREWWFLGLNLLSFILVFILFFATDRHFATLASEERGNIPRSGFVGGLENFLQKADDGWEQGLALDCATSPLRMEYIGSDILAMLEVERGICPESGPPDPQLWQLVPELHPLAIRRALGLRDRKNAETLRDQLQELRGKYRAARAGGHLAQAENTSAEAIEILTKSCPPQPPLSEEQIWQLRRLHCFYEANRRELRRLLRQPSQVFEWGPREVAGISAVDPRTACALVKVMPYSLRESLVSAAPEQWEGTIDTQIANGTSLRLTRPDGRFVPLPGIERVGSTGKLALPWWEHQSGAPLGIGIWHPRSGSDEATEVVRVASLGRRMVADFKHSDDFSARVSGWPVSSIRPLVLQPGDLLVLNASGIPWELAVSRLSETEPLVARTRVNGRRSRLTAPYAPTVIAPMTAALDRIVQDDGPPLADQIKFARDPNLSHYLEDKLRSFYEELEYFNRFEYRRQIGLTTEERAFEKAEGCLRIRLPSCGESGDQLLGESCREELRRLWERCFPTEAAVTIADTRTGEVLASASAPDSTQVERAIRHLGALKNALTSPGQEEIAATILTWRMGLLNQARARLIADHNFDRHPVGSAFKPFAASIMLSLVPELTHLEVATHPAFRRSPKDLSPKCRNGRNVAAVHPLQGVALLGVYEDGSHPQKDGWVDMREFVEWSCNDYVMRLGLLALRLPTNPGELSPAQLVDRLCVRPSLRERQHFQRVTEMEHLGFHRSRLHVPGGSPRLCAEEEWSLDEDYRNETVLVRESCRPIRALRSRGILFVSPQINLSGLDKSPFFQRLEYFGMYNGSLRGSESSKRYEYDLWSGVFKSDPMQQGEIDKLLKKYFTGQGLTPEKPLSRSDELKALGAQYLLFWRGSGDNRWSNLALLRAFHKLLHGPQGQMAILASTPSGGSSQVQRPGIGQPGIPSSAGQPQGSIIPSSARNLVLEGMRSTLKEGRTAAVLSAVIRALNQTPTATRGGRFRYFGLGKTGTPARPLQTRDLDWRGSYYRETLFPGNDRSVGYSGVFVGAIVRARACGPPAATDEPCPEDVFLFSEDGQNHAFDKGVSLAVHLEGVGRSAVAVELARNLLEPSSPLWDHLVNP